MLVLEDYREILSEEEFVILKKQWLMAHETHSVFCAQCEQKRGIEIVFRCLYCGLWFCFNCAEEHFGKTVADYWTD